MNAIEGPRMPSQIFAMQGWAWGGAALVCALFAGCGGMGTAPKVRVDVESPRSKAAAAEEASSRREVISVSPATFEANEDGMLPIIPEIQLPFDAWSEQQVAADALSRIGKPAVPQLVQALSHPDPKIRRAATSVLARMGSEAKDAVPALVQLLDDEDASVRRSAAKTLGRIGPDAAEAVPALVRSLMESKPVIPASHVTPAKDGASKK